MSRIKDLWTRSRGTDRTAEGQLSAVRPDLDGLRRIHFARLADLEAGDGLEDAQRRAVAALTGGSQ